MTDLAERPSWWPGDELEGDARREWVARMMEAIGPLRIPYAPFQPNMGRQEAFLRLNTLEAFYGGAAGGGKSVALLMSALQFVDVPGYAALLLRRTYPDLRLPGALMDMAAEWLMGTDAEWHAGDRTWHFPSTATITFGYLQSENDKYRYRSAEFQMIGFDELTAFELSQYTYLFSRLRRPQKTRHLTNSAEGVNVGMIPLRMRSASNPGGIGHEWVKERFISNETRNAGAVFMPATLDDNPNLDKDAYVAALSQLLPTERDRLLKGDWDASERGPINRAWFRITEEPGPYTSRVRAWDFAATEPTPENPDPDWTVGSLYQYDAASGRFTLVDVIRERLASGDVENLVRRTAELDGRDVPINLEIEPGSSGKAVYDRYARRVLRGYAVSGQHPTGDKWVRARPAVAAANNGLVSVCRRHWTRDWLDRIGRMAPGNRIHDDELDSWAAAHACLADAPTKPPSGAAVSQVRIPTAKDVRVGGW